MFGVLIVHVSDCDNVCIRFKIYQSQINPHAADVIRKRKS